MNNRPLKNQSKKSDQESQAKSSAAKNESSKELPAQLKSGLESLSGLDMSDTVVHKNSSLPAQFKAHAFAQGSEIHLGSGQDQHLAHEAWHVVQQKQGKVQPTSTENGIAVNDDPSLEAEADIMGAKAMQLQSADGSAVSQSSAGNSDGVAQMMWDVKTFREHTQGGTFVKRGTGVKDIDSLVEKYHGLQSDPTTKKEDLVWLCGKIEQSIKGWISYHKDESRQKQRIDKFTTFLNGHLAYERDHVLPLRPEDDEEIDLTDGSLKKVENTKTDSDVIKNLKVQHEGGGDALFKKLGAMVNAMVPQDGDGAKLEVAVKIPIPVAPGVEAMMGGGLTLEAGKDDGIVTTKAAVAFLAGLTFAKVIGVEGKIEGFVEAKAQSASEAIELMSYGLYQRARAGKTPATLTNAIWGGGSGSLAFANAEEKMAERERRIFGPLKEKSDLIKVEIAAANKEKDDYLTGPSFRNDPNASDKIDQFDTKIAAAQKKYDDLMGSAEGSIGVTTGGVVGAKAEFNAGIGKGEVEVSRSSGTKIGLQEIEEAKGDKFGQARARDEIGQGTGMLGNGKKKMGSSVVGWEAKGSVEFGPGKVELGYKREWEGPPDNREAKGEFGLAGEISIPISGSIAATALPYIMDAIIKGGGWLKNLSDRKEDDEGLEAKGFMARQALGIGTIVASAGKVETDIKAHEVGAPGEEGASGKVALKAEVTAASDKIELKISYVKELGINLGVFEAKQEKTQKLVSWDWPI